MLATCICQTCYQLTFDEPNNMKVRIYLYIANTLYVKENLMESSVTVISIWHKEDSKVYTGSN